MTTIKGPGIFLAQFMGNDAPYHNLKSICLWAEALGYKAVQIPTWDSRCIDLKLAAESKTYADEIKGIVNECGLEVSELSTHLQGQLIAVHPAYDLLFDGFAPEAVKGNSKERTKWAIQQLKYGARASQNLGLSAHATFSGSLLWHTFHPWPQRPAGMVEAGFQELANRWTPLLNYFDECGVDVCYEIHPGEDLFDGITYEMFLNEVNNHSRACLLYDPSHFVLQQLDYIQFIDFYHERIRAFHVKDAEFNPTGKQGTFGGYQSWANRAGRYRSPGDGQVDFKTIFSKLSQYDYKGWAVMEWECCIKNAEDGAKEGAPFISNHIIRVTEKAFDDFASSGTNEQLNRKILGIED
ncbi:MAG TPA: sugar phosphate isomerase/epimerase [Chitinophagaceae bacterium]|jgi:sugar phosphate isomerase/epimerase|nr:sugar phosphate isomerase/epimerase [Chitinophagaceae bacterium]HNF46037.1 sugar phosphate isomerase/epimerase [Chitinophagaceae bacterium]HNJ25565.1 sugar phosphate isomerase/epimerase [Chitinophagaceae bacterium]HNJ55080.1 sugar phosphate isomerase/epimerase [Chitinophagaceae bacterium]HNK60408.1 sugar phosphate isomerase/epimerase [Chitinophagaceae bacterium]